MSSKFSVIKPSQLLDEKTPLLDNIIETLEKVNLIQDGTELTNYLQDKPIFALSTKQSPLKYVAIIDQLSETQEKIYLFTNSASFVHDHENSNELQSEFLDLQNIKFEQILGDNSEANTKISDLFKTKIIKLFEKIDNSPTNDPSEDVGSDTSSDENSAEEAQSNKAPQSDETPELASESSQCENPSYVLKYTKVIGVVSPLSSDALENIFGEGADS